MKEAYKTDGKNKNISQLSSYVFLEMEMLDKDLHKGNYEQLYRLTERYFDMNDYEGSTLPYDNSTIEMIYKILPGVENNLHKGNEYYHAFIDCYSDKFMDRIEAGEMTGIVN